MGHLSQYLPGCFEQPLLQDQVRRAQPEALKLYRATDEDHFKLYDLTADLAESRDLASHHPEQVLALSQALERWENEVARDATLQPQLKESSP